MLRLGMEQMGKEIYFKDTWSYFRQDLLRQDEATLTDMELVGVDDAGELSSVKVHRAVILPLMKAVSPIASEDSDWSVVFPDTKVAVLRDLVKVLYEGVLFSTRRVATEVLELMKNLGISSPSSFEKSQVLTPSVRAEEGFGQSHVDPGKFAPHTRRSRRSSGSSGNSEAEGDNMRKRKQRETSHSCQLCHYICKTVKMMTEHTDSQHQGETFQCPYPGCSFQKESYRQIRKHQHNNKHFTDSNNGVGEKAESNNNLDLEVGITPGNATEDDGEELRLVLEESDNE